MENIQCRLLTVSRWKSRFPQGMVGYRRRLASLWVLYFDTENEDTREPSLVFGIDSFPSRMFGNINFVLVVSARLSTEWQESSPRHFLVATRL